jgi:hypothetical protein
MNYSKLSMDYSKLLMNYNKLLMIYKEFLMNHSELLMNHSELLINHSDLWIGSVNYSRMLENNNSITALKISRSVVCYPGASATNLLRN